MEAVLDRARVDCGLEGLEVVRASAFHGSAAYRDALAEVRRRRPGLHEYVARQLADALCLDRRHGGLLKVGWALRGAESRRRRDELAFDRELRTVAGERIAFVYCKPGRALSDEAPRVPPYAVRRPGARLCLDRPEDARAKLKAGWLRASAQTVRACRRHLRALLYTYDRLAEPLPRGPLERRMDALIDRLGPDDEAGAGVPDPEPPERATG